MASHMDRAEVRLRLLEVVVPTASKVGLTNSQEIVQIATRLEEYVLEGQANDRNTLTLNKDKGSGRQDGKRQRKR